MNLNAEILPRTVADIQEIKGVFTCSMPNCNHEAKHFTYIPVRGKGESFYTYLVLLVCDICLTNLKKEKQSEQRQMEQTQSEETKEESDKG